MTRGLRFLRVPNPVEHSTEGDDWAWKSSESDTGGGTRTPDTRIMIPLL